MSAVSRWVRLMEAGRACGCHQLPARSFFWRGYQLPLCARCTGVLLGQGASLLPWGRRIAAGQAALLLLPMAADGVTQLAGLQTSTNRRRLVTGLLAGFGFGALLRRLWRIIGEKI